PYKHAAHDGGGLGGEVYGFVKCLESKASVKNGQHHSSERAHGGGFGRGGKPEHNTSQDGCHQNGKWEERRDHLLENFKFLDGEERVKNCQQCPNNPGKYPKRGGCGLTRVF